METAPTSIEVILRPTLVQSDKPSDLRGSLSPTTRHRCKQHVLVYIYGTWQSQAVTHPIMNRARRCSTSVIEPIQMSERRIPNIGVVGWSRGTNLKNMGVPKNPCLASGIFFNLQLKGGRDPFPPGRILRQIK